MMAEGKKSPIYRATLVSGSQSSESSRLSTISSSEIRMNSLNGSTINGSERTTVVDRDYPDGSTAAQVISYRQEEKVEMQQLNSLLATYVEKLHFLQAANEKLQKEKVTKVTITGVDSKSLYLRKEEEFEKIRLELQKELEALRRENRDYRTRELTVKQEWEAAKLELEKTLVKERTEMKLELDRMQKSHADTMRAFLKHYETMQVSYDKQITEILTTDRQAEHQLYFSDAISRAIADINKLHAEILRNNKLRMEKYYHSKVEYHKTELDLKDQEILFYKEQAKRSNVELESQITTLQEKISRMPAKCDCSAELLRLREEVDMRIRKHRELQDEFDHLRSLKLSLQAEIGTYRQLLNAFNIRTVVSDTNENVAATDKEWIATGEVNVREVYRQATFANGVGIRSYQKGDFVAVDNNKNSDSKDISVEGWTIEQAAVVNGEEKTVRYTFPKGTVIKANQVIELWGKNTDKKATDNLLVTNVVWLAADHIKTTLIDAKDQVQSICENKTDRSSHGNF